MAKVEEAERIDQETAAPVKTVTFKVLRYDPDRDRRPRYQSYEVPVPKGMTVLDGLIYIKNNLDGSLAYRASCRMGICGSCGMFINRKPRLSCQVQVLELDSDVIEVKPLPNYPNIKDLVPDLEPMFDKHQQIKPFLIRQDKKEQEDPSGEYLQSPEELEDYLQLSYCIKCGLCLSACPTVATDPLFLGPQALPQAYRYSVDSRDEGFAERLAVIDSAQSCWRCHFAGACTESCPKGVDPALAIQLLKRKIIAYNLGFGRKRKRKGAPLLPFHPRPGIPKPPPRTVK
ncbi:MAG: succinate dehydrogenase/fumarate reductase iron-sulfur subunit [Candidatus Bipolaricaulia bacterium]